MANTYKAVEVTTPGVFTLVERSVPEPRFGQVRIRVDACGVCHSDSATMVNFLPGIIYPRAAVLSRVVTGIIIVTLTRIQENSSSGKYALPVCLLNLIFKPWPIYPVRALGSVSRMGRMHVPPVFDNEINRLKHSWRTGRLVSTLVLLPKLPASLRCSPRRPARHAWGRSVSGFEIARERESAATSSNMTSFQTENVSHFVQPVSKWISVRLFVALLRLRPG